MAGMIPREFIDDLLTRIDVVDVIGQRVTLKKKGKEFTACCPFHHEKTPSFSVSPTKQFYHCFGCGVHGTAINFLMDYEHQEFVEAIETLAQSIGLDVPRENTKNNYHKPKQSAGLYDLLSDAAHYYHQTLAKADQAKQYFSQRGLSAEVISRFNLGYAPAKWDNTITQFSQQYGIKLLQEAGLVIESDHGKQYDRFRDRVMFPIRDKKGRVIGFGGRVMGADEGPKYLNSPETTAFHKGQELYGLFEARQHTRQLNRLVVVEGYMDVISLAQFDISYAVATLGTATTKEHIGQLFRLVDETIFCFDGDRAGREAAWRAVENALPVMKDGKEIRFLFLPTGEDPDSYVRKQGKAAFEQALMAESIPLSDYLFDNIQQQYNLSSREGKARFTGQMSQLLNTMPDSLIREQLINDVSKLTAIDVATFKQKKLNQAPEQTTRQPIKRMGDKEIRRTPIRFMISVLLSNPDFVSLIKNPEQIARYDLPGIELLSTLIETIEESPHINAAGLVERWRNTPYASSIAQILTWQSSTETELLQQEFLDALRQVRKLGHESKMESLLFKAQNGELSQQEKQDLQALLQDDLNKY